MQAKQDKNNSRRKRLKAALVGLPSDENTERLADFYSAFADRTRLRIISALLAASELSVGQLSRIAGTTDSAVSHQLKTLRLLRLITYRSEGRMSYYRLDDEHIEQILKAGLEHVMEQV
ncbi:MAG TPA: metalloregulator ArsR/SmtB family transcription factor [Acidobacteriota bacterium]|nr:metalloregulator ArsR/SmtB family transcription factor [Acidobacteriota bacterium]